MKWPIFLFFCGLFLMQSLKGDAIRKDYCVMSGQAKRLAEREIYEKFGFHAMGSGGGAITVIRNESLSVETDVPFTLNEGRQLLIACLDILLEKFNSYRPLRPFLFDYPFPIERVEFSIFLSHKGRKNHPKDNVTVCDVSDGKIKYFKSSDSQGLILLHQETYEEALQIVAKEYKELPLPKNPLRAEEVKKGLAEIDEAISKVSKFVKSGEAASDLPRYFGPQAYVDMAWFLDAYALTLAKKHDMEFHLVGSFSDETNDIYPLMFISFHHMTLQQGKQFAVQLVRDFLEQLRKNSVIKKYNEYRNESYKDYKYPPLLTDEPVPEQMAVKISFWDKNFDRVKKPYLAEIVFLCGNFYYYQANSETQVRELILKESFVDAMDDQAK